MSARGVRSILGRSGAVSTLRNTILKVAPTDVSVLLSGETGTGKELAARAIHHEGSRRAGPFVAVNCAAIPDNLADSEFFGHEAGAFSGARGRRQGLLEQANGGTLFLDEVAELPLALQSKLLRAVQEREVVRVGSDRAARPTKLDIRIICASHHDLLERCGAGLFREDLYYRLCGYPIELPPLRARGRDRLLLAKWFLSEHAPSARLGRDAQALIVAHTWPGNVRELRAAIRAATIDSDGRRVKAADLTPHLRGRRDRAAKAAQPPDRRQLVLDALSSTPRAIGALVDSTGIPATTLRRVLKELRDAGDAGFTGEGRGRRYVRAGGRLRCTGEEAVQELLAEHGVVHRRDFVALTGVAPRTANRQLDEMVARGVLRPNGRKGRAAGYLAGTTPS